MSIPKIGLQKNENKSGILKSSRSLIDKAALSHPVRHNLRLCYARLTAGGFMELTQTRSEVSLLVCVNR